MSWRERAKPVPTMGWRERATPVEAPTAPANDSGLSEGGTTTAGLHALDALSVAGVPTVLGAKDALSGVESADPESKGEWTNPVLHPGEFADKAKGALDRYYRNKEFYQKGMDRLARENPGSAVAGSLATLAVPGGALLKGAKLAPTMLRGTALGAATGLARGPAQTLRGDVEGTAKDAALGAGVGGVTAGVAALPGKAIEAGGNMARGAMGRLLGRVRERTASDIGKFSKKSGEGVGAAENLWIKGKMDDEALQAAVAARQRLGPRANIPFPPVHPELAHRPAGQAARLMGKRASNADRAMDVEEALVQKYGPLGRPTTAALNAKNLANVRREAGQHLFGVARGAALGAGGAAAADAAGLDPAWGAAIGGAGGLYSARKISQAIASHPATLQRLMKLAPIGRAVARLSAKGAATPSAISAIVYSMRDEPEVQAALAESFDEK